MIQVRRDPKINWITAPVHKHREARGLTSIGKQNRGLGKGHGHNKTPRRAAWRRNNTCVALFCIPEVTMITIWLTFPLLCSLSLRRYR